MVTDKELVEIIRTQSTTNERMLNVLQGIKGDTARLEEIERTLDIVVEKYGTFKLMMEINITLSLAMIFALIAIAWKI